MTVKSAGRTIGAGLGRRKLAARVAAAVGAGLAAALLVSCGSSGGSLIPVANAGPLQSDFEAVALAAQNGDGNCGPTEAALAKTELDFSALPSSVDSGLRNTLSHGIANLRARATALCAQPLATTGTTPTTTRTSTTTTTLLPKKAPTVTAAKTTSKKKFSSATDSNAKSVAPPSSTTVSNSVLSGSLSSAFAVADVPLRVPGLWTLATSTPITAQLLCTSRTVSVSRRVVIMTNQSCQLQLTSTNPEVSPTWQLTPIT